MKAVVFLTIVAWASQYAPGVMDAVLDHRQTPGYAEIALPADLPKTDGFVAVADCNWIGQVVWLMPVGANRLESFLVADCAVRDGSDGTLAWMARQNVVVEVDHKTAIRWNTIGQLAYITRLEVPRLEK